MRQCRILLNRLPFIKSRLVILHMDHMDLYWYPDLNPKHIYYLKFVSSDKELMIFESIVQSTKGPKRSLKNNNTPFSQQSIKVIFPFLFSPICSHALTYIQCWLSGSRTGSGSACFWAFRIRIHQSEVRIRIRILPFSHRCVERTEIMPAK
jgi:hypothetical protein